MRSTRSSRRVPLRLAALPVLAVASIATALSRPATPRADAEAMGPAARLHVRLASPVAGGGGWIRVGDVGSFAGTLTFEQATGRMAVVNEVPLEDYVGGIAEMPADWPMPSLEAQAIAARTYGLYHALVNADHGPWAGTDAEICATDSCQVYRGLPDGRERVRWAAAVSATAGQVLLYRGRVIEAFYASSDGGRTRSGTVPWLPSVADPDDAISPYHHWTWSAPLASFAPVVGVPADQLVALSTTPDAVVATVRQPPGSETTQRTLDVEQFKADANRLLPNPQGLPLPLPGPYLSLTTQPSGTVQVEGWGFGHGLGMSQYGALGKALRGMSAGAILGAYYGPARATRLPPRLLPQDVRVLVASDRTAATVVGSGPLEVVDDHGTVLGQVPTGALSVETGPSGVRARVVARPAVTDAPEPPAPLHGLPPTFADVRGPLVPPPGAPTGPPSTPNAAPPAPAAVSAPPSVLARPPAAVRIPPPVTGRPHRAIRVAALAAGVAGTLALGVLLAVGLRRRGLPPCLRRR